MSTLANKIVAFLPNFFKEVKDSFYNPKLYKEAHRKPFNEPFWLFVKIGFLSTLVFVIIVLPSILHFIEKIKLLPVEEYFPAELELVLEEGIVASNVTEPYYINTGNINDHLPLALGKRNFISISTYSEDLSLKEIENLNAIVVLTDSRVVVDDDNDIRIFKISETLKDQKITVNIETVGLFVEKFFAGLSAFIPFLVALSFVMILSYGVTSGLTLLLLLTLITLVIAKSRKIKYTYVEAYKVSMYALVPAIAVDIVTDIIWGITSFSFLLTILVFIAVLLLNLKETVIIKQEN